MSEWISVTERLPEVSEGVKIVVVDPWGNRTQCLGALIDPERYAIDSPNAGKWRAYWITPEWKMEEVCEGPKTWTVTHWQKLGPLPEPPKE